MLSINKVQFFNSLEAIDKHIKISNLSVDQITKMSIVMFDIQVRGDFDFGITPPMRPNVKKMPIISESIIEWVFLERTIGIRDDKPIEVHLEIPESIVKEIENYIKTASS